MQLFRLIQVPLLGTTSSKYPWILSVRNVQLTPKVKSVNFFLLSSRDKPWSKQQAIKILLMKCPCQVPGQKSSNRLFFHIYHRFLPLQSSRQTSKCCDWIKGTVKELITVPILHKEACISTPSNFIQESACTHKDSHFGRLCKGLDFRIVWKGGIR